VTQLVAVDRPRGELVRSELVLRDRLFVGTRVAEPRDDERVRGLAAEDDLDGVGEREPLGVER